MGKLSTGTVIVLLTGLFDLAIALLCDSAMESTRRHWLHDVESKEFSAVFILWVVGLIFVAYGRIRQDASENVGYLLTIVSAVLAGKLCWFG